MLRPNYISKPENSKTATTELEKLTEVARRRQREEELTRRALMAFPLEKMHSHTIHCSADICFSIIAVSLAGVLNIFRTMPAMYDVQMFSGSGIRHFAPSFENYGHDNYFVEDIAPVIAVCESENTGNYFKWWTNLELDEPNEEHLDFRVEVRVLLAPSLMLFGPALSNQIRNNRGDIIKEVYDVQFEDSIYAVSRRTVKFGGSSRVPKMVTFWDDTTLSMEDILRG
jgi:hypothetical protein